MARFTDPLSLSSGSSANGTWIIEGGTLQDPQPTFNGAPLFSGQWTVIDGLCTFAIDVDMDNILTFGTGQFYMKVPYAAKYNTILSGGCIHDNSTGNQYFVIGDIDAGSDVMKLFTVSSNGLQVPFSDSDNSPFKLNPADSFHIAGTYAINY